MEAWSCVIVGDPMDRCGGGGAAEDVAAMAGGLLFALERELMVTECGFPGFPGLVGRGKALAVLGVIPWTVVAAEALPKTSPPWPEARCSRLSVS